MWTALQFDSAVLTVGTFIDNKLEERWDNGTRKYSLSELLMEETLENARLMNQLSLSVLKQQARSATHVTRYEVRD